jgi:excinuclease ABC subunit B
MSIREQPKEFLKNWSLVPKGDQPQAINFLVNGLKQGLQEQILLGATGSGKTFTMANIIAKIKKPTLIIAHNKTLAAQLFQEFKTFFKDNAVEFFISYYDYYQPEAYIPSTDTFIDKTASINEDIDKMRHRATRTILERDDVIVISSVSCIYGLGNPKKYLDSMFLIEIGMEISQKKLISKLISMNYTRNDISLERNRFKVRGQCIDLIPSHERDIAIRIELWNNRVENLYKIDALTLQPKEKILKSAIYPSTHHVVNTEEIPEILDEIKTDLLKQTKALKEQDKHVEAQRLQQRTLHDIEMIKEIGYCQGIENYSRYLDKRQAGEAPATLLDYFPKDFLLFIDESHVTVPQVGGMYRGDRARKENLVNFGFRLPAALDNRPLTFEEFKKKVSYTVYVSATPGNYEMERAKDACVEQIIRPTGLLDPVIEIKPTEFQVDDLQREISLAIKKKERVLITTLTKKMSQELSSYYLDLNVKVKYLHSDITSLERVKIIRELRQGVIDVLIGVNLLREGLDLPEVALVVILDADKEGFLRSRRSLIQTVGRAARHVNGRVIFYADRITDSMQACLLETQRRRKIQEKSNLKNKVIPKSIVKEVPQDLKKIYNFINDEEVSQKIDPSSQEIQKNFDSLTRPQDMEKEINRLEKKMKSLAQKMEFEEAGRIRDLIYLLKQKLMLNMEKL